MMLELYFSEDEIIEFLATKQYVVREVSVWEIISGDFNEVENVVSKLKIAYRGDSQIHKLIDQFVDENKKDIIEKKYGLNSVFKKEIKKKLLKL